MNREQIIRDTFTDLLVCIEDPFNDDAPESIRAAAAIARSFPADSGLSYVIDAIHDAEDIDDDGNSVIPTDVYETCQKAERVLAQSEEP